jgi:hypothetical protein
VPLSRTRALPVPFWFAAATTACGVGYFAGLAWLMLRGELGAHLSDRAKDGIGFATLVVAQLLLGLVVSVHSTATGRERVFTQLAAAFATIFTATVSINRFVQLTVVRAASLSGQTAGLERFQPYSRGSVMFAVEILGWGVFLSLAALCLAPAFHGSPGDRAIRWSLRLYAALGLVGAYGYATHTRAFYAGFVAWGAVLYVSSALIAFRFARISKVSGLLRYGRAP